MTSSPRILVAILTRHNPTGLVTLIGALDSLAKNPEHIDYLIRYDEDDMETAHIHGLFSPHPRIHSLRKPRPITLGAAWNETLLECPPWDIAIPFPDDIIPLCEAWDTITSLAADNNPAFSWWQTLAPTLPMYPTVTRAYWEAAGRKIFPEFFPFWESDRWFWETYELAFGRKLPIIPQLSLGGRRGGTRNMREIRFWFEFYDATRQDRVREAKRIRSHFVVPNFNVEEIMKLQETYYKSHVANAEMYQQGNNPNPGPPSPQYIEAKRRAINYLADRPN